MAKEMDQDRRDALHWEQEWRIRRRNKRVLTAIIAVVAVAAFIYVINYISILGSRTIYGSEEEMRTALQGRFATDYAEDIVIEGDSLTLTYYNQSHYDLEFAETYGYSEYDDSVYDDKIVKWDYRRGEIKLDWMSTITVDKDGNLRYYSQTYVKTNEPKPTPIDPSELSLYKKGYSDSEAANAADEEDEGIDSGGEDAVTEEVPPGQEAAAESQEETQAAAEEAGVEPLPETGDDV